MLKTFSTDVEVITIGEKTTVVNAHTLTGFDTVRYSSCVDPKNYSEELDDRINKLASFINTNPIFETLQNEEREDMKTQLIWMYKYINVLANRLRRQNVEPSKLLDK